MAGPSLQAYRPGIPSPGWVPVDRAHPVEGAEIPGRFGHTLERDAFGKADLASAPPTDGVGPGEAAKQFALGLASPVTNLFKDWTHFGVGATAVGGTLLAMKRFGAGRVGKVLSPISLGMAVWQLFSGVGELSKGETGDAREGWKRLGTATTGAFLFAMPYMHLGKGLGDVGKVVGAADPAVDAGNLALNGVNAMKGGHPERIA